MQVYSNNPMDSVRLVCNRTRHFIIDGGSGTVKGEIFRKVGIIPGSSLMAQTLAALTALRLLVLEH